MAEKMKDSGNQWIGMIPASWGTKKIKYLSALKGRIGWQGLTSDEYQDEGAFLITGTDFDNGRINWDTCVHIPMKRWDEAKEIQIQNGDLLITKDGTVGKVAIVSDMPGETSLNSGVLRIMTEEGYDKRFLFWVLQSDVFWNWFHYKNAGNSTIVHLYQGDFAEFMYAFPNRKEQQAISDLLDKRCGQIDDVIADIEKQIDILRKYRQTIITELVTGGINREETVPSGINWLGNVPKSWKVKRMKYCLKEPLQYGANESGIDFDDTLPRYIRITDIDDSSKLREDGMLSLEEKIARPYLLEEGDILLARSGATVGKTFLYTSNNGKAAFAGYLIKAVTNDNELLPKYLFYYTLSILYDTWKSFIYSQATIPNIGADKYSQLPVTVPSISEQKEIIQKIDKCIAKIDSVIFEKKDMIEEVEDFKKSLIYEYVTGKKRIKEVPPNAD